MNKFAALTGRQYHLFDYYGHPTPDRVLVIMGSGACAVKETVDELNKRPGVHIGVLIVRLYRPFSIQDFIKTLPKSVTSIAVLDRCKEPNANGEPLYTDIVTALHELKEHRPMVIGGRYGLSSKEFTPAMAKAVFKELKQEKPKLHFTVGIEDDVTHLSLDYDKNFVLDNQHTFRGLFYGLGADGTVSANKNSIKIIGEETDNYVQGYFVYDSKKSGSLTVSHLRFGKQPIQSTYLVQSANFIACHHFNFLTKFDVLKDAEDGATFLLNTPYSKEETWQKLPKKIQEEIIEKHLKFYGINAVGVARETGMGGRINTILQTCFFAISNILPREEGIIKIKEAIYKTYSRKGDAVVQKNYKAVDQTVDNLFEIDYGKFTIGNNKFDEPVPVDSPKFVKEVLGRIIKGEGDELPVSVFPVEGTYPTGTTKYEKRNIAEEIPVWDADICTQCGKCYVICPHAAIRPKVYDRELLKDAPSTFKHIDPIGKEWDKTKEAYTLQVATEDCTGCGLCVDFCPMTSKTEPGHKAINMVAKSDVNQKGEIENWDFFINLPEVDRARINKNTIKGSQFFQPLFEFSGACSGCGETPYIKLLTQLYGEKMIVANATGCSSIYGGNLPTTPWATNKKGVGPAWANSLFEDNAEFGLGIKLAADKKREMAITLLTAMKREIGEDLAELILNAPETTEAETKVKQELVIELKHRLSVLKTSSANNLYHLADFLLNKSIWIIGGDGWAYDIGYGGLDHVLSTGENVNIMVLDTEVYSNTGGQASKSSPLGSSAKFAVNGKKTGKKDLALQAIAHGGAYVASIALGANDAHTLRTIIEAENFPGPSLILAYSHCIAHGFDLSEGAEQQQVAVKSGYWPLFHFNPMKPQGQRFVIDSKEPEISLSEFMYHENRFKIIKSKNPELAEEFLKEAEEQRAILLNRLNTLKGL
jgi:pyruvate-ferredoxin/flavodoxin oxidoreductase